MAQEVVQLLGLRHEILRKFRYTTYALKAMEPVFGVRDLGYGLSALELLSSNSRPKHPSNSDRGDKLEADNDAVA